MYNTDRLDEIVEEAAQGIYDRTGVLSTGERLYVALASGKMKEVAPDYTIPQALARLGSEDIATLIERWQYRSLPRQ